MEMGAVTVQDTFGSPTWTVVSFAQAFSVRPVVAVLPTTQGGDPSTLRVRNVTTTGFEVVQTEPTANDGPHVAMNTAYVAVEPGVHTLPDGSRIAVIEHSTTTFANRFISTSFDTVFYGTAFSGTPVVIAQIQTMANESQSPPSNESVPFMDVGIQNVGTSQMQVTLERAESTAGSVSSNERIGLVVFEDGVDITFTDAFFSTIRLQSLLTPDNIEGFSDGCFANSYASPFASTPIAVASQNRRDGNNGGWVRRCSTSAATIGLTIDEDIDNDSERNHTGENAGVIAASGDFHATFTVDLQIEKNVSATSDPINGPGNPFSIPGADMEYVIAVSNLGTISPDTDSIIVTDELPAELRLCVTASCLSGGPVVLDVSGSPIPPGVSIGAIDYSDDNGTTYTYTPVPDPEGFDAAVDAIRITMDGQLAPVDPLGAPSFDLIFTTRIN